VSRVEFHLWRWREAHRAGTRFGGDWIAPLVIAAAERFWGAKGLCVAVKIFPHHVFIEVTDMERAVHFYTEVLGLPLLMNAGFYARVGGDRFWIGMGVSEIPVAQRREFMSTNVSFFAEDVDAAYEHLTRKGVEFYHPPFSPSPRVRIAEFYDSEGNRLSLSSDR